MKDISDKYWSLHEFAENYTGQAQSLLDYLDEAINNPYVEPDLKFIRESLFKVVDNVQHQISNSEMFGLIKWEQTILNDMDNYVKVVPENYEKILDKETGVEIKEILDNLKWQSSQMLRVLTDNIKTFQTSYFDLQSPLIKAKNIGEDLSNAKNSLELKFNKIWDQYCDETFDDDFAMESENILKDYYAKLENVTQELCEFMKKLTKKFKDKEQELKQKFTEP